MLGVVCAFVIVWLGFGSWNIVNVVGCFCGGVDCLVDLS